MRASRPALRENWRRTAFGSMSEGRLIAPEYTGGRFTLGAMTLQRLSTAFADTWLPRGCALCDRRLAVEERGLCRDCEDALPGADVPRCQTCGLHQPHGILRCPGCEADPPPWDRTIVLADYAPPIDRLVVALKFHGELAAARPLGHLLGVLARSHLPRPPDVLLPVPLGTLRIAERGYNQSTAIALAASRSCGVPVATDRLHRARETPAQSTMTLTERARNLEGAMRASASVDGLGVAIVDDVMTTGATLRAAGRALREAGARFVVNLVATRTP